MEETPHAPDLDDVVLISLYVRIGVAAVYHHSGVEYYVLRSRCSSCQTHALPPLHAADCPQTAAVYAQQLVMVRHILARQYTSLVLGFGLTRS